MREEEWQEKGGRGSGPFPPYSDLGMMPEAEELLSDICRFYSEDKWLELSAPSYALLADCQRSLELEDQYPQLH